MWSYQGPGHYSWGHGREEEDVSSSDEDEEVTGAARDEDERRADGATGDSDKSDLEIGTEGVPSVP